MSKETKKYYKPGTLEEKGTKVSLKTQPYINGVVFDTTDPITSFHFYLIAIRAMIEEYEILRNIPGMDTAVPTTLDLKNGLTGKAKLLLDFLIQSPIEIILKDQKISQEILNDLSLSGENYED